MSSPSKLGVRFVLEDQNGELVGRTYWEDPVTHEFQLNSFSVSVDHWKRAT